MVEHTTSSPPDARRKLVHHSSLSHSPIASLLDKYPTSSTKFWPPTILPTREGDLVEFIGSVRDPCVVVVVVNVEE